MDPRAFTAFAAIVVFGLATICVIAFHRIETTPGHPHCKLATQLLTYSLWSLALLGVYSSTSFIWADDIAAWALESLRYIRLAITTVVGIMLIGVLTFYVRILRRGS